MSNTIELKPIKDLLGMNFYIPSYQRGYRWTKQQVDDLLNDIFEYQNQAKSEEQETKVGKFYCLQPIVVKKRSDESYELIDGQQRLTALWLILVYLEKIRKECYDGKDNLYTLKYETRKGCEDFFTDRQFVNNENKTNIDFYHISMTYSYIVDWFSNRQEDRYKILSTILGTEKNVQVIFYELSCNQTNPTEVFTRLNEGKIPLTDAELIKATLLQSDRYSEQEKPIVRQRLSEIASEWDLMEASLRDDRMWYMLTNDQKHSTHIELLFHILAKEWNTEYGIPQQKHFEYIVFEEHIKKLRNGSFNIESVNEVWKDIKRVFNTFLYWYTDHQLYHYVGYLLAVNTIGIFDLYKKAQHFTKDKFVDHLCVKIAEEIKITSKGRNGNIKTLDSISYGEDNSLIIKLLLLHNIETLVKYQKESARFPFHLYKEERITSIEHIHPQNPEDISTDNVRATEWLKSHQMGILKFSTKENEGEIKTFIDEIEVLLQEFEKERFQNVYSKVLSYYNTKATIKENEVHTLYNLALVDKNTNSSLNNSFFDVKREILKRSSQYIPICTQRAFSKYYSEAPSEMIFWSDFDRKAYFADIQKVYDKFNKTNLEQ